MEGQLAWQEHVWGNAGLACSDVASFPETPGLVLLLSCLAW